MILSGRDLQLYMETGKLKIEPVTPEQFQQNGVDLILDQLDHKRDVFYLGCTRETISLPDDLMAFVEIRSSWARRGYFLPPTIVDAGFQGNLTLEILNYSWNGRFGIAPIDGEDYPIGKRFAHLIFAKTSGPCIPYCGKYTGQTGITEAKEDAMASTKSPL